MLQSFSQLIASFFLFHSSFLTSLCDPFLTHAHISCWNSGNLCHNYNRQLPCVSFKHGDPLAGKRKKRQEVIGYAMGSFCNFPTKTELNRCVYSIWQFCAFFSFGWTFLGHARNFDIISVLLCERHVLKRRLTREPSFRPSKIWNDSQIHGMSKIDFYM